MPRNRYEFTLTIIGVEDLINISTFGKRDAFIEIEYNYNKYTLPTIHDAGNCPLWESNLSLSGNDNHVRIIVMEKRLLKRIAVGEYIIDLDKEKSGENSSGDLTNTYKHISFCGRVLYRVFFVFPSELSDGAVLEETDLCFPHYPFSKYVPYHRVLFIACINKMFQSLLYI